MSPETLQFLYGLLCAQTLAVGADDFDDVAAKVVRAKTELSSCLIACTAPAGA